MNLKDIYVVNRALDGKDIFSLPSFSEIRFSELLISAIKENLIDKGILQDYDSFTDKGVVLANRLKLFKEAKKHVSIDHVNAGILSEKQSVIITWNPLLDDYTIKIMDTAQSAEKLAKVFRFLIPPDSQETKDDQEAVMSHAEFAEAFRLMPGLHFRLRTASENMSTDEVYLSDNGRIYVYDYNACILNPKNQQSVWNQINERLSVS